ncbi:hypothetical protein GALL_545600 [mine drainage metagenome]|uniref:Uncharacterized protein n=1 Tax=mine drainage metagenome TaxID=410659 RepID=A0A1J5P028_9ZZZZ
MELRLQSELPAFDLLDLLGQRLQRNELRVHVQPGDIALRQRGAAAPQPLGEQRALLFEQGEPGGVAGDPGVEQAALRHGLPFRPQHPQVDLGGGILRRAMRGIVGDER